MGHTSQRPAADETHVARAIRLAGGPAGVAREFDIRPWAVSKWRNEERVPADRILPLCELTGWQVTPYELDAGLYPDPDWLPPGAEPSEQEGAA